MFYLREKAGEEIRGSRPDKAVQGKMGVGGGDAGCDLLYVGDGVAGHGSWNDLEDGFVKSIAKKNRFRQAIRSMDYRSVPIPKIQNLYNQAPIPASGLLLFLRVPS
jgi:hypothetical protein